MIKTYYEHAHFLIASAECATNSLQMVSRPELIDYSISNSLIRQVGVSDYLEMPVVETVNTAISCGPIFREFVVSKDNARVTPEPAFMNIVSATDV